MSEFRSKEFFFSKSLISSDLQSSFNEENKNRKCISLNSQYHWHTVSFNISLKKKTSLHFSDKEIALISQHNKIFNNSHIIFISSCREKMWRK